MARQKPIPAQESLTEMIFPLQGIDVSTEFELQPDQTTPIGQNVRGYEPATMRARGGSRNGLSRYINARVSGANLIQHLNYVITDDGNALFTSNDPLDGGGAGGIPDPSTNNPADPFGQRNPGRQVRTGGSGVGLNRKHYTGQKLTPKVTAKNQTKIQGTTFNFLGTEFTQTGLLPGDAYTNATITSAGQVASAASGNYQIGIANPVPNASLALHQGQGKYNPTQLIFGSMTVSPNTPIAINLLISGGKSNLDLRSLPFGTGIAAGPFLGYKNWRVVQYLKADTYPTFVLSESGVVDASGTPQNVVSPAPNMYAPVAGNPSVNYSYVIRFEVSPDGTTWPTAPTL